MKVSLANRQSAKFFFVEYSSTRRKKKRALSANRATRDRMADGTDRVKMLGGRRAVKRERHRNVGRTARDETGKTVRTGRKR